MAIVSLVLGILGLLLFLPGVIALVLGILSYREINRTPGLTGAGMAITGIVMGGLGSCLGVALGGIIIGLGESFVGFYQPAWGQTVAFLLLVLVLLIRPRGLLGK